MSSSGGNCFRTSLGLTLYTNTRILSETFRTASAGWCRPEEPNSDNVRQVSPLQQLQYLIRVIAFNNTEARGRTSADRLDESQKDCVSMAEARHSSKHLVSIPHANLNILRILFRITFVSPWRCRG